MYNASAFAETPKTPKSFPRDFAGMLQASRKTFLGFAGLLQTPQKRIGCPNTSSPKFIWMEAA
jgi:hypothetical protein